MQACRKQFVFGLADWHGLTQFFFQMADVCACSVKTQNELVSLITIVRRV